MDVVPAVVLVFVYGTLTDRDRVEAVLGEGRPGEETTSPAAPAGRDPLEYEFRGPATLEGCHRADGRYPTLAPGGSVEGRLLALEAGAIEALDRYEGVESGLYVRVRVPLTDGDRWAWTYVGDPARLDVADDVRWPASPASSGTSFEELVRPYVGERCVVRPDGGP